MTGFLVFLGDPQGTVDLFLTDIPMLYLILRNYPLVKLCIGVCELANQAVSIKTGISTPATII